MDNTQENKDTDGGVGTVQTMIIGALKYVEKKPGKADDYFGICIHCDLMGLKECDKAINGLASAAFGGDCEDRDVVYKVFGHD